MARFLGDRRVKMARRARIELDESPAKRCHISVELAR